MLGVFFAYYILYNNLKRKGQMDHRYSPLAQTRISYLLHELSQERQFTQLQPPPDVHHIESMNPMEF